MNKKQLKPVVKAVVAQMAKDHSMREIRPGQQLASLGFEDAEVTELKTCLYRLCSGQSAPEFQSFFDAVKIVPASTVQDVVDRLSDAFQATSPRVATVSLLPGDDPTLPKGLMSSDIENAVRAVLAQISDRYSVAEIGPKLRLSQDLGLDDAAVAGMTTRMYKALTSSKVDPGFARFYNEARITPDSTVAQAVQGYIDACSLAGMDATSPKG